MDDTQSESSATSSVRYAAHGKLKTPLGVATLIPVNIFLERVLPPLSKGVSVDATAAKLKRMGKKASSQRPITLEGRWRGFRQDPAAMKCQPCSAFRHFPEAVSAIMRASCTDVTQPHQMVTFRNNPAYIGDPREREAGGLPNAYLLLGLDATWANLIASGEYRKTDRAGDRQYVSFVRVHLFSASDV